jgi:hypothetical protein
MLITLTVAADNFSWRHHVLMIASSLAGLRSERFTSQAATDAALGRVNPA